MKLKLHVGLVALQISPVYELTVGPPALFAYRSSACYCTIGPNFFLISAESTEAYRIAIKPGNTCNESDLPGRAYSTCSTSKRTN